MKIFGFVKKLFFVGLTILSDFTNVSSLSCISMKNTRQVKQDHKLLMLIEMNLCFFHLVLKQVNVVLLEIILTICMQRFVFLIL